MSGLGCLLCDSPRHHKPLIDIDPIGPEALTNADVTDAITHCLLEAWTVLKEYGVPKDRWLEVLKPTAVAIGRVGAAADRYARASAMEDFWEELVARDGEGTYMFVVGPRDEGPVM